jgi:WD40 repeat protein
MAFSPDGRLLVSASSDYTVRLWDVVERRAASPVDVLSGHTFCVHSVSFSSDGQQLASGSFDRAVRLWSVPDGVPGPVLGHTYPVYCVAFSPVVGSNILASNNGSIGMLWDVSEVNQVILHKLEGHFSTILTLAFSPDGSQLVSGSCDSTLRLWSVANRKMLRVLTGHSLFVPSVAFHPNGKQVASCSGDNTVRIWTVCEWSDRNNNLFPGNIRRVVFCLMCIKAWLESNERGIGYVPRLPMALWLDIMVFVVV